MSISVSPADPDLDMKLNLYYNDHLQSRSEVLQRYATIPVRVTCPFQLEEAAVNLLLFKVGPDILKHAVQISGSQEPIAVRVKPLGRPGLPIIKEKREHS